MDSKVSIQKRKRRTILRQRNKFDFQPSFLDSKLKDQFADPSFKNKLKEL